MCFKIHSLPYVSNVLFDILRLFFAVLKTAMQTSRRRHIPPLPVELIFDHPQLNALPIAGFGMVLKIILHFWHGECANPNMSDERLFSISQAHKPTWHVHRPVIKTILADVLPVLARAWHTRMNRRIRLAERGLEGASARRLDALRKKTAPALTIGETITTPRVARDKIAAPAPDARGFRDRG